MPGYGSMRFGPDEENGKIEPFLTSGDRKIVERAQHRLPVSVLSKPGFQWASLVWLVPISATLISIYLVVKYF